MRRRIVILALAVLALPVAAPANPLGGLWHWAGRHKRFLLMEGTAITAAAIHYKGLNHCRKVAGQEACDEHYGEAYGFYWFVTGVNLIAMPAAAEGCWKNDGGKFCYILAYSGPAYQAWHGIYEWRINKPREIEPHAPTPDLLKLRW